MSGNRGEKLFEAVNDQEKLGRPEADNPESTKTFLLGLRQVLLPILKAVSYTHLTLPTR